MWAPPQNKQNPKPDKTQTKKKKPNNKPTEKHHIVFVKACSGSQKFLLSAVLKLQRANTLK